MKKNGICCVSGVCLLIFSTVMLFGGCKKANKTIIRQQHLEEGVQNPTSIEELKDAIKNIRTGLLTFSLRSRRLESGIKFLEPGIWTTKCMERL